MKADSDKQSPIWNLLEDYLGDEKFSQQKRNQLRHNLKDQIDNAHSGAKDEITLPYRDGTVWKDLLDGCDAIVAKERALKIALIISGISSKQKYKIHLANIGDSQKGKSWVMRKVGEMLFGKFDYEKGEGRFMQVDSTSNLSHFYDTELYGRDVYSGKIAFFEEIGDASEDMRNQIKKMTSRGITELTHKTVEDFKSKVLKLTAMPVVWANTRDTITDGKDKTVSQLLNRFLIVNIDESTAQDKAVYQFAQDRGTFGETTPKKQKAIDIAKKRMDDIMKDDCKYIILNPFAKFITYERYDRRNIVDTILDIICVVTYMNRPARPSLGVVKHDKEEEPDEIVLLSSLSDNMIGMMIWAIFESYKEYGVAERYHRIMKIANDPEKEYLPDLIAEKMKETLPRTQCLTGNTIFKYLKELVDKNIYSVIYRHDSDEIQGQRKAYFKPRTSYSLESGNPSLSLKPVDKDNESSYKLGIGKSELFIPSPKELVDNIIIIIKERSDVFQDERTVYDILWCVGALLDLQCMSLVGKSSELLQFFNVQTGFLCSESGFQSKLLAGVGAIESEQSELLKQKRVSEYHGKDSILLPIPETIGDQDIEAMMRELAEVSKKERES